MEFLQYLQQEISAQHSDIEEFVSSRLRSSKWLATKIRAGNGLSDLIKSSVIEETGGMEVNF